MKIYEDNLVDIWNDLLPQRWPNDVTDAWPGFLLIIVFTLAHYFLNLMIDDKARNYATNAVYKELNVTQTQDMIKRPDWMSDSLLNDLNKITSLKKFKKSLHDLLVKHKNVNSNNNNNNSTRQFEMIEYYKQLLRINKHVSKFKEAFFKVIIFGFVYVYGILLLCQPKEVSQFFWEPLYVCKANNWPENSFVSFSTIFNLNNYYWLQLGYHGHRAVYQMFEHSRKDFMAMFIHHWLTVFLLCGSYAAGYQQIGSTVLLCNDNIDLIVPVGKLGRYLGYTMVYNALFILFGAAWIPLRVCVYFYKILYPLTFVCYESVVRPYFWIWLITIGLYVIYALQLYWTTFLFQMLYHKFLKGDKAKDVRSDDEGIEQYNLEKHQ